MNLEICGKLFESFRGGTLYAGFSGGADSTAVLLAARLYRKRIGFRLTAVHFDHGLRGEESRGEARDAARFAAAHGIEFRLVELHLAPGPNLEARARNARLDVWKRLAGNRHDAAVILGHHADDRAETLLLRLLRGSNASGLVPLRERSRVEGVTFLRPLLRFRRSEIEAFLRDNGISGWAVDSSNADESLTRNALRNRILPALYDLTPGSESGLFRSLDALADDAVFLEAEADRRWNEIAGTVEIPFGFWRRQPPAMRVRLLRRFLAAESGRDFVPNRSFLDRFEAMLSVPSPELRLLPVDAERTLALRNESVSFLRNPPATPAAWRWRELPETVWNGFRLTVETVSAAGPVTLYEALFDADALPDELIIDRRRDGDRLVPFGEAKPKPLKKLRCDRKIPAGSPLPVLRTNAGTILWAPGIRHSNHAAATPATARLVRFACAAIPAEVQGSGTGTPSGN